MSERNKVEEIARLVWSGHEETTQNLSEILKDLVEHAYDSGVMAVADDYMVFDEESDIEQFESWYNDGYEEQT